MSRIVRRNLKVTEVSLVRSPANPGALVTLHKREEEKRVTEPLSKADLYAVAKQKAEAFRKPGEAHINVALGRFFGTPEGQALRLKMEGAPGPVIAEQTPALNKHLTMPSLQKATELAHQLRAKFPELSLERARAKVWEARPDLVRQYNTERAGAAA